MAGVVTVAAITPGPNNFIVMAAAARGGLRRALPAISGVLAGSLGLLTLVWAGAGALFEAAPAMQALLRIAGALYLAWLGVTLYWQARTVRGDEGLLNGGDLPSSALGVASFQFLNPKGWVLVLTATASVPEDPSSVEALAILAGLFLLVSSTCLLLWAGAGAAIGRGLQRARARRWFLRGMGVLLTLSATVLAVAP